MIQGLGNVPITMNSKYRHLIFDFDGTLVDSAPVILDCLQAALTAQGLPAQTALHVNLIGPPLLETLQRLTGIADHSILQGLAQEFRDIYDRRVAHDTPLYDGMAEVLATLNARGQVLHIATNKRLKPANLILKQLGISHYFAAVYAIDAVQPPYPNKTAMLAALLAEQALPLQATCYIGDRREDGLAAAANGLDFLAATWGYDEWETELPAPWQLLRTPAQLL